MRSWKTATLAAAAVLGLALSAATAPASAQVARPQLANSFGATGHVIDVQWRRHGWRGGYRGRYYRRGPSGAAIGVGIAAGIIGAGIAAAAAPPPVYAAPPPGGDAEAYCEQRFRSYDPGSGTYLGYDGARHPCP